MGVFDFERNRLRQQKIELKALIALSEFGRENQKHEALKHLEAIAYPNAIQLEPVCPKCNKWDCGPGPHGGLCVYSTKEEIKEWEKKNERKS